MLWNRLSSLKRSAMIAPFPLSVTFLRVIAGRPLVPTLTLLKRVISVMTVPSKAEAPMVSTLGIFTVRRLPKRSKALAGMIFIWPSVNSLRVSLLSLKESSLMAIYASLGPIRCTSRSFVAPRKLSNPSGQTPERMSTISRFVKPPPLSVSQKRLW